MKKITMFLLIALIATGCTDNKKEYDNDGVLNGN